MPAVFPGRLRPLLQLSLLLSLSASPVLIPCSWAESADRRGYQVPAGSLGAALTRFAGLAGVNLSVDPALVSGRNSNGLSGEFGVEEGFTPVVAGVRSTAATGGRPRLHSHSCAGRRQSGTGTYFDPWIDG